MKRLLRVISSPSETYSQSRKLGDAIVRELTTRYTGLRVTEKDLSRNKPPFLGIDHISGFFKHLNDLSTGEREALQYSDAALAELMQADCILIEAPMYNLGIHAALKAWIDQVVRLGHTFVYNEKGERSGTLAGKKAILAIVSGGTYPDPLINPVSAYIESYLRAILGFMGIADIRIVRVDGTAMPDFSVDYEHVVGERLEVIG